ncbi:MAG: YceI family protein [Bacteroidetes bacterium]|nr:YceI family protein [Bacteroidota bacterium]
MKKFLLIGALATASLTQAQTTNWALDKSHSGVKFTVKHLVISEVEGSFKVFNGSIASATPDFNNAKVDFSVDVNSINTDEPKRDAHLKGDDFFNAEKFPEMKFSSTSFKKVKGNAYVMEGNLTIRDITKKVRFAVVYGGTIKDPWGNTKAGFKASGKINRKEFGLKWNNLTEAGGAVVGDEVKMLINVEFAQAKAS